MKKKPRFYYGYVSTFLAGLTIFGSCGILTSSSGVLISELINTRGWNAGVVGAAYTLKTIFCLLQPVIGMVTAKFGPRKTICWTTVITCIFLCVTAYVKSAWGFVIFFGIGACVSSLFNDMLGCQAVVANWWVRRQGRMASFINAMNYAGGMVIPLIIAALLLKKGWTATLWIMSISLFVITALPQFFFMKDHPEEVGQAMEEGISFSVKDEQKAAALRPADGDWGIKEALKTAPIWLGAVICGLLTIGYLVIYGFGVTKFVAEGMDSVQAASFLSAMSLVAMILALLFGRYVDRLGARWSFVIMSVCGAIGCLGMNMVNSNYVTWIVPVLGFAVPLAMMQPTSAMLITQYFGQKNFAPLLGYYAPVYTIISAPTSMICGILVEKGVVYNSLFLLAAGTCLLGVIPAFFVKAPRKKLIGAGKPLENA